MIRYGNPQEVIDYFADGSASQSYLKNLIKGVDYLEVKEEVLYYEEKGHFKIGSAVDVWITQGKTNFDEQYFTSEGGKPSDAMMSIAHMIFDNVMFDDVPTNMVLEDISDEQILSALDFHKYQGRWKTDTRIQKVKDECSEYFEELKMSFGKTILTDIESTLVYNIVMSFKSGKYTAKYFQPKLMCDTLYQVPIYFTVDGIPCKALLDMVIIDHNVKKVYPIDIKTMGDFTINFPWTVKGRGYNIQGAFYTEALIQLKEGGGKTPIVEFPDISGYDIMGFKFLVETTKFYKNPLTDEVKYYTGKPLVFALSHELMQYGKVGRPALESTARAMSNSQGSESPIFPVYPIHHREVKGYMYALSLHRWHSEHGFEEDKQTIENNGVLILE